MSTSHSNEDLGSASADSSQSLLTTSENEIEAKYDLDNCSLWIRKNNYLKTCLQFPEHLLNDGTSAALYLQDCLGRPVYLLADTSYGSCCVDEIAAQHVDADSIIHFGHACLSPVMKLPVLYVFEKQSLDLNKLYESLAGFQEDVVIFYDDIYHHLHGELCSVFETKLNVKVSSLCLGNENNNGEVICGRVYGKSATSEVVGIYLGDESVTLQNLVLGLPEWKWYQYSKEGEIKQYNYNRNKFLMQRSHLVNTIKNANVIGILFGTLGIQNYLDAVDRIKALVKAKGKKCYMLAVGKPNVAKLANFPEMDVFVCIACQENSLLKDFKDYYKPVVSLFEIEMALGDRPYGISYTSDFRQLLPGGTFHKEIQLQPLTNPSEVSQDLIKKEPGTVMEFRGAEFLTNRTWRGLELNKEETEVCRAVKGRSGIPLVYENELETLSGDS